MFFHPKKTLEPQQGYPVGILLDWCLEQSKRLLCGPLVSQPPPEAPKRTGGASQGGVGIMWLARLAIFSWHQAISLWKLVAPKAEWDRSTACCNGSWDPPLGNGTGCYRKSISFGGSILRGRSGCTKRWLNG